jgi:leader peptidase (prepilin peptidase)/N-methyltransferase
MQAGSGVSEVPTVVAAVAAGALGALSGPVLARLCWVLAVPGGEPRRSRCQDCGTPPPGRLPGLLRRRCTGCGRRIGPAAWWLALLAAGACALCAARIGPQPALAAYVAAALASVVLAVVDAEVKRLPDVVVRPLYAVVAASLALAAATDGHHGSLPRALEAMAALVAAFYLLVLISPAALGLGDVKLVGVLGLLLGWIGWTAVAAGIFLGFATAALAAVALLATGRAGRKDSIPFGPFLLLGALLALLL